MSAHLVVVDMQHVFADENSAWRAPRFGETLAPIARLVEAFAPSVTFTRFVAPENPDGAWRDYYEQWPFALQPADARLYALVEQFAGRDTLDLTTFGKWGDGLRARVRGDDLVVAGVSTDCCVLSTVLPAADTGVRVHVAADACAGATDETHEQALAIMRLYAPLVLVASTDEIIAGLAKR